MRSFVLPLQLFTLLPASLQEIYHSWCYPQVNYMVRRRAGGETVYAGTSGNKKRTQEPHHFAVCAYTPLSEKSVQAVWSIVESTGHEFSRHPPRTWGIIVMFITSSLSSATPLCPICLLPQAHSPTARTAAAALRSY